VRVAIPMITVGTSTSERRARMYAAPAIAPTAAAALCDWSTLRTLRTTMSSLSAQIKEHVSPNVKQVMTDEFTAHPAATIGAGIHGSKHETIKHKDKIYVRGEVHTNTIESAFSLFKRGLTRSFHKVSIKHLQRYLDEFCYRFNRRNDDGAFIETVRRLAGFKPLPFATLTSNPSSEPF
jgi:hypothetical protein